MSLIREVYLINTSHVDITWWNSPKLCAARIVESMDEAIRLADADPDFRFSIESVYAVYLYLNEKPERRGDLVRLVNEGRLDIGGLYVAPVSDYCSDEAIYRNFIYGKLWLLENLGIDTPLAREEDSPGHTLQFPQLCRGFGMRFARFSRGPMGMFRWRAPDGSEVITFTAGYSWGYQQRLGRTFDAKWRDGFALRLRQADEFNYHFEILMLPDGDDNAFPNPDGPKLVSAWNAANESPKFRTATITDFFKRIERAQIPVRTGDIPNQWAQIAVFQPDCFEQIRRLRHTLPAAELCMALAAAAGRPVDISLETVWRTFLEGLDHNWGGRFQGAYGLEGDRHKLCRLRSAADSLSDTTATAADAAASGIPDIPGAFKLPVFNTLSCVRTEPVAFTLAPEIFPEFMGRDVSLTDAEGREFQVQKTSTSNNVHDDFVFIARETPPAGFKTFYIRAVEPKAAAPARKAVRPMRGKQKYSLENDFYRISLHSDGAGIRSIYDRELGREITPDPSGRLFDLFGIRLRFNEVWALGFRFDPAPEGFYDNPENEGEVGENIVITGEIKTAGECAGAKGADVTVTSDRPVFSSIRSRIPFFNGGSIEQEVILYNSVKRIDLSTTINWTGAENYLLNIAFPFGPENGAMTMDVPFGSHTFGTEVPGFWGKPGGADPKIRLLEKLLPGAAKKWLRTNFLEGKNLNMAAMKDKLSQAMMKENSSLSRGLYNWLDISTSEWGATLLARHAPFDFTFGPNACLFASILSSAFFNGEHYLRRGSHTYVYTLTSHRGGPQVADTHQTGRAANAPLIAVPCRSGGGGGHGAALPRSASAISCDAANLVMTALKHGAAPNEFIARFYESAGNKTIAKLTSSFPIRRAALCDFMERETYGLPLNDGVVTLEVGPYKIVTVKFILETI